MLGQSIECIPLRRLDHPDWMAAAVFVPEDELVFVALFYGVRAAHTAHCLGAMIESVSILDNIQSFLFADSNNFDELCNMLRAAGFELSAALPVYIATDDVEPDDIADQDTPL